MSDREDELVKASRLESLGRNLTSLALKNIIGPIYERKEIIADLAAKLSLPGNNVILVGEPGTGKNAVVEGLACWMARKEVDLPYQRIVECTHVSFQAFCLYAHEFETKFQMIVEEVRKHKALIFFDQINLAIGAGSVTSAPERTVSNLLNPYLARNEIGIIGATTPDGYKAMLKENPSFTSKFIRLDIPSTGMEETLKILKSLKTEVEDKYQVFMVDGVLEAIVDMSERFYRDRHFPGKAFEVLRDVIASESRKGEGSGWIKKEDVYHAFRKRTGLPDFIIHRDRYVTREEVKSYFTGRIFGQDEAIDEIVNVTLSLKAELNDPQKPVAVFLFAGPTGVGKTYLARLLALYLFGAEEKLLRYDMSEYSTLDGVEKLIGGRMEERRGKLNEDVLASPFSVILFDEIEKAHPVIFDLLLGLIGEGRLTDSKGRTVNFCNTIIIMTSNIGADLYSRVPIGIDPDLKYGVEDRDLLKKLKEFFRPEFINRLTKIVSFKPLPREQIKSIARKEIEEITQRKGVKIREFRIEVAEEVIDFLLEKGYTPEFGARPMQRAAERYIGYPLAEAIAQGEVSQQDKIKIEMGDNGKIKIDRKSKAR